MRRWLWILGLLGAAAAGGLPACFTPHQPGCAFSCADEPHRCPADYSCGDDGFCHRDDGQGLCLLTGVDAGTDAPGDGDGDAL